MLTIPVEVAGVYIMHRKHGVLSESNLLHMREVHHGKDRKYDRTIRRLVR